MTARRWCDACRRVRPHEQNPRFPTTWNCDHCGHGVIEHLFPRSEEKVDGQRDMPPVARFNTWAELSQPDREDS